MISNFFFAKIIVEQSRSLWNRPPLTNSLNSKDTSLIFQQIEIDHVQGIKHPHYNSDKTNYNPLHNSNNNNVSVFRIYGITKDQNSVTCFVHGFLPYFFIPCPTFISQNLNFLDEFFEKLQVQFIIYFVEKASIIYFII